MASFGWSRRSTEAGKGKRMEILKQNQKKENTAVALGTFDGLHLGHRSVLARLKEVANAKDLSALVCTFSNLPSAYFGGEAEAIFTPEEKIRALEEFGVDMLYMPAFGEKIAEMNREEFARQLFAELGAKAVVVGFNYRFGKNAEGTPEYLAEAAKEFGAEVVCMPPYLLGGAPVSSTRIRTALREGDVEEAERLLGRPYEICDVVAHGKQLGRQLGFPTLNFYPPAGKIMPRHGVYAAEAELQGKRYAAVTNIGIRPTVADGDALSVESNLVGFSGNAYGELVSIRLLAFLRGEQQFAGLSELTAQIEKDKKRAEECVKMAWQRGLQPGPDVLE